jgi:hypothetical protein
MDFSQYDPFAGFSPSGFAEMGASTSMSMMAIIDPENTFTHTYIFMDGETEIGRQILKDGEILLEQSISIGIECKIFE